jgi:hypothetical protein
MAALGLESPGQLGATFLADARDLARFCGAVPPLSDAHPHRISTDMRDRAPNAPAYREMMDDDEARRRFSTSPWVEANLPGEIRAASTVLFRAQRFVNYALYPAYRPEPERAAGDLREVLASTRLQTLPLWLLGSSPQELAIAQTAVPSGAGGSEVEFHLAAGALAHRDSAAAAEHLRASIRQGGHGADARLQLLLKALSGGAIPNHGLVVGSGAASTQ